MYQSVDDLDDDIDFEAEDTKERRALIWKLFALALIIFGLIAIFVKNPEPKDITDTAIKAESASYHTAISEMDAPLRRARLRDFATTYPESTRLPALYAQLHVLETYEGQAWTKVMDASYNPQLSRAEKLLTIQTYEEVWKSSYLGGRESDLKTVKKALEDETVLPDRKLKIGPSPISNSTPDHVMAGGPRNIFTSPVVTPPPPPLSPPQTEQMEYKAEITRSVTPRYPGRAQRRGIEAIVELSLSIDDRGRVRLTEVVDIDVDDRRYERSFLRAAERAALRTRYKPYIVNGVAQPISGVRKRYRFQISR